MAAVIKDKKKREILILETGIEFVRSGENRISKFVPNMVSPTDYEYDTKKDAEEAWKQIKKGFNAVS